MSEEYDIKIYLYEQLSIFLNAYTSAKIETMTYATDNFKDICKNSGLLQVVKQLDEWKSYQEAEATKIIKENAQKTVEKMLQAKNIDEYALALQFAQETITPLLYKLEKEYWDSIRGLMLHSVKQDEG